MLFGILCCKGSVNEKIGQVQKLIVKFQTVPQRQKTATRDIMADAFEDTLYYVMELASYSLIDFAQRIGYLSLLYTPADLNKLRKATETLSRKVTAQVFGKSESIGRGVFA